MILYRIWYIYNIKKSRAINRKGGYMKEKECSVYENSEKLPLLEKFLVARRYDIFKFGGTIEKNEERGIQRMLKYFSTLFSEEQLRKNLEQYNLQRMFEWVKEYFQKEYNYDANRIILSNRYQKYVGSYTMSDEGMSAFVHIDEVFESAVISFLLVMFIWSKEEGDTEIERRCFNFCLFLLNELCIFGELPAEDAGDAIAQLIGSDMQILQLAEECYWNIVIFTLAHEVAHVYLADVGRAYTRERSKQEELEADRIAYHIVLKIIIDKKQNSSRLEERSYLAPMMYMDFFSLYYYTDATLYGSEYYDPDHPSPQERIDNLFDLVNRDEYEFDTIEGNHLYSGFLDANDWYKERTIVKKREGKLDKIIHMEKRKQLGGYYDNTGSNQI